MTIECKTTVWIIGRMDDSVTVNRSVTELDEISQILGFADYYSLRVAGHKVRVKYS